MVLGLLLVLGILLPVVFGASDTYVKFKPHRGYFTGPFQLALTSPDTTLYDSIRYVVITSNSLPGVVLTATSGGTVYSGPLSITGHCIVEALGFHSTTRAVTNLTTHSFVFRSTVYDQASIPVFLFFLIFLFTF